MMKLNREEVFKQMRREQGGERKERGTEGAGGGLMEGGDGDRRRIGIN